MNDLSGRQRKYLRGLAHALHPVVTVGRNGVTDNLKRNLDEALEAHELVKLRFFEFKSRKAELVKELAETTNSQCVGTIGNVAVFYRQQKDVEKRQVCLP